MGEALPTAEGLGGSPQAMVMLFHEVLDLGQKIYPDFKGYKALSVLISVVVTSRGPRVRETIVEQQ